MPAGAHGYSLVQVLNEARQVRSGVFRGSRRQLATVTAQRLMLAMVLLYCAGRMFHLSQAAVDLTVAGSSYTRYWLALAAGAACLVESGLLLWRFLRRGRLSAGGLLAEAAFDVAALAALSAATTAAPGRAAAINWMLQYSVATCAGLGLVAGGDLMEAATGLAPLPSDDVVPSGALGARRPDGARTAWWSPAVVGLLMVAYTAGTLLPHPVTGEDVGQVVGNCANFPVFFLAGFAASAFLRRVVKVTGLRNAEVARAAAALAEQAQWRAVGADVFGPVSALLDELSGTTGPVPERMQLEAGRLIELIEAVRPSAEAQW